MDMRRFSRKKNGIALLMVLSTLALLSGIVVEFAYNSNVTYNLAMNEKERVQAYYLAESGLSLSKLILRFDKDAQSMAGQASQRLGRSVSIQPLYELIPLNSELLRGLTAEKSGEGEKEGEAGEGDVAAEASPGSSPAQALSSFNLKGAESFLAFEGDFASEISEEESKINVNAFFTLSPTQRQYERLKSTLYHLLLGDDFKGLFEDKYRGAQELAQNIADYIDRDDAQNEPGGQERGREGVGTTAGRMKNGKLLTVEELMMVPGMTEEVYRRLKDFVTVYSKDEKIFVCRAKEPVVKALILAYTENNAKMEPLKDDNQELLTKALDAVLNSCPDLQAMANELDTVLGATTPGSETNPSGPTGVLTGKVTPNSGTGSPGNESFSNLVRKDAVVFTVVGIGKVGETEVRLKTVLDTTNSNPERWVPLYWRVE